jgi:hypothetical protein
MRSCSGDDAYGWDRYVSAPVLGVYSAKPRLAATIRVSGREWMGAVTLGDVSGGGRRRRGGIADIPDAVGECGYAVRGCVAREGYAVELPADYVDEA